MFNLKLKETYDYDVLIAGAGPAGASAAAHLAGAGLKVALVDQQAFPRDKVCGDFVGPVALLELRRLGVTRQPAYRRTNIIHRAAVHLDGRLMINSLMPEVPGLPTHGAVIPRMTLDAWIVAAAQAAGAHLIENCRVKGYAVDAGGVTVTGEQRGVSKSWRARLLIGADGSSSLVARLLHGQTGSPDNRIIAVRAYYEDVRGPADQCDLYFSSDSFPGYYWLFPTSETTANVGVGMLVETLPPPSEHLAALLERLVEQDPAFSQRIGRGRRLGKISGWPLTTYDPASPITAERVLLTGDAAGLINPLNGEGIQYALLSGRWAAETVLEAAAANDFSQARLKAYAVRVDHELRYDMALAALIVQLIRNRSLNPVWMQALRIITTRARVRFAVRHRDRRRTGRAAARQPGDQWTGDRRHGPAGRLFAGFWGGQTSPARAKTSGRIGPDSGRLRQRSGSRHRQPAGRLRALERRRGDKRGRAGWASGAAPAGKWTDRSPTSGRCPQQQQPACSAYFAAPAELNQS